MRFLRQSTASQVRTIGPFLDDGDFKTAETGLTIANTDIRIKKNGADDVAKNSGGGTHDVNGCYHLTFDATDTNTVGELFYTVKVAGALQVFGAFTVLEEAVYDALFAASAPGYGTAQTGDSFARIGAAGAGLTALGDTRIANLDAAVSTRMATYTQPTGFLAATFPGGTVANTTNITAGTITTVTTTTNLTNLPSIPANWLTAAGINDGAFTAAKFASGAFDAVWTVGTRTLTSISGLGIALASKLTKYVQLLTRKDAAIATDNSAEVTEINADGGSGGGAFANTTDALESIRDRGDAAWITGAGGADPIVLLTGTIANADTLLVELGALTYGDNELNDHLIAILDNSTGEVHVRWIDDFANTDSVAALHDTLPFTTEAGVDTYTIFVFRRDDNVLDILTKLPASLVSGRMDCSVGAMQPNTLTATAIATGAITNAKFAAGAIDAAAIANGAIDAATFAADMDAEILSYIVDDATRIDASSLNTATVTTIPAILTDTAEIGAAGAGLTEAGGTGDHLTAINLPDQTMNITGDITGNLSGSVASVTGAVASVTAAVTLPTIPTDWISAAGVSAGAVAKINLGSLNVYATGTADAGSSQLLLVDSERTEPNVGYFKYSRVIMTSGANAGQSRPIFAFDAGSDTITLLWSFQNAIAEGDTYAIVTDLATDVAMWGGNYITQAINGLLPSVNAAVDANGIAYTGTADGGSTTTLDDAARIGDGDDYWNGNKILFTNGNLAGIERLIVDYASATGTFTLAPPLPNAVTTQAYAIVSASMQDANATHWIGTEITEQPHTDATLRAAFGLAAANLDDRTLTPTAASSANSMWENVITVDDATEAPTTTVFETDQTTDSAARYNEAVLTTRTGTNPAGISRMVTAYAFTNGKVKLTLGTPLPSAPADGDTFTLMGLIDQ